MFEFRCLYSRYTSCMFPRWLCQLDNLLPWCRFRLHQATEHAVRHCYIFVHTGTPTHPSVTCITDDDSYLSSLIRGMHIHCITFQDVFKCFILKLVLRSSIVKVSEVVGHNKYIIFWEVKCQWFPRCCCKFIGTCVPPPASRSTAQL